LGFRYSSLAVFQIQLSHQQAAVPLTRDYITGSERGLVRSNSGTCKPGADDPCQAGRGARGFPRR
jgi:cyclopropane-fatty-acyl-phospholipid synthase